MTVLKVKVAGNWTEVAGDVPFTQTLPQPYIDFVNYWTPTAWTNLTLQNGWTNSINGAQYPQYRRVGDTVELRGRMKDGVLGSTCFVLPVGFRPNGHEHYWCASNGGTWVDGLLEILSTGTCIPHTGGTAAYSLAGISFSTIV